MVAASGSPQMEGEMAKMRRSSAGRRSLGCRALVLFAGVLAAVAAIASPAAAAPVSALAWGEGKLGQLGDGADASSSLPVLVNGLKGVAAVAGGGGHSLALLNSGVVMAFGGDIYGQLGDRSHLDSNVPVESRVKKPATAIAAGAYHSLALIENGTVEAWGENLYGQLGDGASGKGAGSDVPVVVTGLTGVTAVAAEGENSMALLGNGTVVAWGLNDEGELGNGTTTNSDLPVAVTGLTGVKAIAVGREFGLALLDNGTVMAWGSNNRGQLGNGTTTNSKVPIAVPGLSGVKAIAAGFGHSLALRENGTVVAWGANSHGELGNAGTEDSHVPVPVTGLSGVTAISATGGEDSMALLSGGNVMDWGSNNRGQLGNGTTTDSDVPVKVQGLNEILGISAGGNHSLAFGPAEATLPAPVVKILNPATGPETGGIKVKVEGQNFTGATSVMFGSKAATFTVNTGRSITAVLPPGAVGPVNVTVTTPSGTSTITPKDVFKYKKD